MDERAVRGIPWTLVSYAAPRVISVGTTIVLARLLVPEDFGLFALATLTETALSVFTGVWLGATLVVRPDISEREKGTVLTMMIGASAIFTVVLIAAAPLAARLFGDPRLTAIIAAFAGVMLINGPNWFYQTILQRELEFRKRFVALVAQTVAFSSVALMLAVLGAGVWSLVFGYLCGYLAHCTALLALAPYHVRPAFDRVAARRIIAGGRGFLAQDLAAFLTENIDYIAVGRTLGPTQLGFYSMAYRQADLPNQAIADPVARVTFPAFAQMRHRGEDVSGAFLTGLRLVALATFPIGVILSAAAAPFTLTFFGGRWERMIAPLAILGVWAVVRPLQVTVGRLLNSLNRADVYGAVSMMSLLPFAVATFLAASSGGIAAVAWVLLAHMTVTLVVMALAVARYADIPFRAQVRALWPPFLAFGPSWALTRMTATATSGWPPLVSLVASGSVCALAYVGVIALAAPDVLRDALRQGRRALGSRARIPAAPRWATASARRAARPAGALLACGLAAVLVGSLSAASPAMAIGLVGGCLLVVMAFATPVAHLLLLIAITALVPYEMQQTFSLGGGQGAPGLFVADVLLLTGLLRAGLLLIARPPSARARTATVILVAFLCVCVLQAVHGVRAGRAVSDVGSEFRVVLGFGTLLIALPILAERRARDRLFKGLLAIGLALGLWGIAQWTLDIPFSAAGDAGVRAGVRLTTAGRGQIQGGLYGFPVAAVLAFAALMAPVARSATARALLLSVLALNGVSLLLTYERTFWLATLFGFAVVVATAPRARRARALVTGAAVVGGLIVGLAVVAPAELAAGSQRLSSIGEYASDSSVRYRETESRHALAAIQAHPIEGSGLAAAILWGRPYEGVRPTLEAFVHNGYLWLAWKLGIPGAALLLLVLGLAAARRPPPVRDPTFRALRGGAQAALLALLVINVTFTFSVLGITATIGLLIAMCTVNAGEPAALGGRR